MFPSYFLERGQFNVHIIWYCVPRNESPCSKLQGIIADFVLFYPLTLTLSPGRGKKGIKVEGINKSNICQE